MILRTPRFGTSLVLALDLDIDLIGHHFNAPGKPLKEGTQDVKVRTYQAANDVEYSTFNGQFDAVSALVREQGINPALILAEGDNATTLDKKSTRDELKLQVIAITRTPAGMTLAQAQASIGKSDIESRFKKSYVYVHFIAAMDDGIDISSVGGSKYTGPWAQFANAVRIDRYVDSDTRTIAGSKGSTKVVNFYGRNGDRTTLAMYTGSLESTKVLTSGVDIGEQLRQAPNNTFLLQAVLDSRAPYSTNVDAIARFLDGIDAELNWIEHVVDGSITEMAGVDDTNNFIFTLQDGDYAHMPVTMVQTDETTTLVPSSAFGVKATDIGSDDNVAQIARVSFRTGLLVSVDQNGGEEAIRFSDLNLGKGDDSSYGQLVATMVKAAGTDQLAA
ncbi:MAG: hypothetical protein HQ488_01715 [Parcubacteria group bacterium]|nr:hypothetical protein [Parcubacteria group bacterium]